MPPVAAPGAGRVLHGVDFGAQHAPMASCEPAPVAAVAERG